ncbi:MAG: hypothetical protein JWN78_1352 [Bacteroidota bacterium]|nr:hypothetical protein [Bacteroidota bacterium]
MKHTQRIIFIVVLCIIFFSCCKKHNMDNPVNLSGKVKSIEYRQYTDSVITGNFNYSFTYDQSGRISEISENSLPYLTINYLDAQHVKLTREDTRVFLMAHMNGETIESINSIDSVTMQEVPFYRIVLKNNTLDTLIEPAAPAVKNIKNYNFSFDGSDYPVVYATYLDVLSSNTFVDSNQYEYLTTSNANAVPLQEIHSYLSSYGLGYDAIDPLYVLGLNGWNAYSPNKHLKSGVDGNQYAYMFNSSQQVSEMTLGPSPLNLHYFVKYILSYY